MLNTKSSTSSDVLNILDSISSDTLRYYIKEDKLCGGLPTLFEAELSRRLSPGPLSQTDYRRLLEELLAEIHRDGGQFTKIAGLMTSLQEAHKIVIEQRCKITRLLTTTRTR